MNHALKPSAFASLKHSVRRAFAPNVRLARNLVLLSCVAVAAACSDDDPTGPGPLASLTVSPVTQTLAIGATQQFTAVAKDASGATLTNTPTWSVEAGGGTISATGLFTAGTTPGTFTSTVKATSGSVSSTATVTVLAGALASIVVSPNPDTTAANGTKQFTAVGRDASGNTVAITPVWSVANGGGTIVSTSGLFTAGATTGTFTNSITATSGTISGTATTTVRAGALANIVVTPDTATLSAGGTRQYTAVGRDAAGNAVTLTPVWSIAAGGGTISATGLFTAGTTPGTFANTVVATSGTIVGRASVTVASGALASIIITPSPASLMVGGTQQFTAVGRDSSGNAVTITPIWSLTNGGGTISATGLFTAGNTSGSFANTVRAASGAISASASITVGAGALSSIVVTPSTTTLDAGATQQFTAVGRDSLGNTVTITPAWTVANNGGTIGASTGLFTAGNTPGAFANTVVATSGAITGSASVTVNAISLVSITVTPNPDTTIVGTTQQFVAVGRDANGNVLTIAPTWSLVNGGGSINSSTGLFTAGNVPATYTNSIVASVGAVSGTATSVVIAVPPPSLVTITVTPNPVTVSSNGTQQFTAVGRDAEGNVFAFAPVWSLVFGGGSIDANTGLFTAGGSTGTFTNTVRASGGTVNGAATVTVVAPPAAAKKR